VKFWNGVCIATCSNNLVAGPCSNYLDVESRSNAGFFLQIPVNTTRRIDIHYTALSLRFELSRVPSS